MSLSRIDSLDVFRLEDTVWVASQAIGAPLYDFAFERFFACRRPWERPSLITAIGRFGAAADYQDVYARLLDRGVELVNSPSEHTLASELPAWYPHLQGRTPRSAWFAAPPPRALVEREFGWPVFVKGARQTAKHSAALSIARDADAYDALVAAYASDPILRWQPCVVREFVRLRPVAGDAGIGVPPSFEFRSFWLSGELVGAGPYWTGGTRYDWTATERAEGLALAREVAATLHVPFLVVDLAQLETGEWIVVECNDAQEAGYAGISPFALWARVLEASRNAARERQKSGA